VFGWRKLIQYVSDSSPQEKEIFFKLQVCLILAFSVNAVKDGISIYFFMWRLSTRFRVMAFPFSALHDHTDLEAPHSVGLSWTSDQPDAETST
jgi:hypothetical protein